MAYARLEGRVPFADLRETPNDLVALGSLNQDIYSRLFVEIIG